MQKERQALTEERDTLRRTVRGQYGFDNIIGHTQPMRRVFEQARLVAKWNTTVLIRGETGTGKELIANAIHYNSPRAAALRQTELRRAAGEPAGKRTVRP
jgi:Nif-specific regulatory protein